MKPILYTIAIIVLLTFITYSVYKETVYQKGLTGLKASETSGSRWLNSPPINLANLKGKIVLIDFWDYTCVNCLRTLPYVKEWHNRYSQYGFIIIGVHAPEFGFAEGYENVKRAVKELGIKYPVVLDNDYKIWKAYRNRSWPRKILIDETGETKFDHAGEGKYTALEIEIQELLKKQRPDIKFPELMKPIRSTDVDDVVCYPTTRELYAGFLRGRLGNIDVYHKNTISDYKDPGEYMDGKIYINGKWFASSESLRHIGPTTALTDYIAIKYHAVEVNAVLNAEAAAFAEDAPIKVFITQDGKPLNEENKGRDVVIDTDSRSYVLVASPKMYNLIKTKEFGSHVLRLYTNSDGLSLYAFTFGTCPATEAKLIRPWMFRE
ncbi:MAG: redoxin family protein [Candidatus Brocadiales bacterium]